MSKKILVFAVLFSFVISMMITQEASALTRGAGQYSQITASHDPSKVCGNHICYPGENSKWSSAVQASQRQGPGKATGAQYGDIVMHQMVVNSWIKHTSASSVTQTPSHANAMPSNVHPMPSNTNANSTGSQ
jgi:hypothetical protein